MARPRKRLACTRVIPSAWQEPAGAGGTPGAGACPVLASRECVGHRPHSVPRRGLQPGRTHDWGWQLPACETSALCAGVGSVERV